jgi:dGTPase
MTSLDTIRKALDDRETDILSPDATTSAAGYRRKDEIQLETEYRQAFAVDVDRILYSLAYTRYIDKTQVFYLVNNDHITHRVLHVQLVSKVARTIGRFLRLNEDLIEAIALGHDIGHAPFGHEGETYLSELCRESGIGYFNHNVQSVHFLDRVEKKGKGWNLCLQTLDGILCHDGEVHNQRLSPQRDKSFSSLDRELMEKTDRRGTALVPMTLEGCVVRMADTISYIGRDIEDAIRLDLIKRSDLPSGITRLLGNTNGTIVYRLVTDLIQYSTPNASLSFSPDISTALKKLKDFNYEHIYLNPKIKQNSRIIEQLFRHLFDTFLEDLVKKRRTSVIFTHFLEDMSKKYIEAHRSEEIIRDFLAGMTDSYFLKLCPEKIRSKLTYG